MNKLLPLPRPKIRRPPDVSRPQLLFVCWGNVCRSPAARSVFSRYCRRNLTSRCTVDSAGVCVDEYPPAPSMAMRWAALVRGYSLASGHRTVYRNDLDRYQLVVAMDDRVLQAIHTLHRSPRSSIHLLSDFLPAGSPRNVPDPMNRSRRTCHLVLDLLEAACPAISETLSEWEQKTVPETTRPRSSQAASGFYYSN